MAVSRQLKIEFSDPLMFTPYPFAPTDNMRNPYPDYARALAEGPVHRMENPTDPQGQPSYYIYGRDAISQMLLNDATFSVRPLRAIFEPTMGKYPLGALDEPEHGRYRALLAPGFRPRLLARWEDRMMHRVIDEVIDGFAVRDRADLVREFTFLFPARIIAEIMGLPEGDLPSFFQWAVDMVSMPFDPPRGIAAGARLKDYFASIVSQRRASPGEDLISELVEVELDGRRLEDEEIYSFLRFLLPAGMETTYRASGSLLFHLLQQPEQLEALRGDDELIPRAFEEALRVEPPLPYLIREALRDTELMGCAIPEGSVVYGVVPSANRDPSVVADPDRFDIQRQQVRHLSFGYGAHICLGMHLARLETRIAIQALLQRLPRLRWDQAEAERIDAHMHGTSFRAPTALPVAWDS